jgi:chromosomal replication initiation ATPase DnaA
MSDDRILGGGDFVASMLKTEEKPEKEKMTRQEVIREVKRITGISYEELASRSREREIVKGRAVYCYLRKERSGASGTELMKEMGLSSGTVSYLAHMGRGACK